MSLPRKASIVLTCACRRGYTTSPAAGRVASASTIWVSPQVSGQFADRLLEDRPGFLAVFSLPFGIETGGAQLITERRQIGLIEGQPLGRQFFADRSEEHTSELQ